MKNKVVFSDWTSVSQIVNSYNPEVKVESTSIIENCGGRPEIVGYVLTVYTKPYVILYRMRVDMDKSGVFSLSAQQAVEMLNTLGFICEYQVSEYYGSLTNKQIITLNSLKNLGYSHVIRSFKGGRGQVVAINSESTWKYFDFRELEDYNYLDWIFLPLGDPQPIDGILKEVV